MVETEPLDQASTADLSIYASNVLSRYNKLRHEFYNKVGHFYRQAATSNYVKESELVEMLERLQEIKARYQQVCDILTGRGVHTSIDRNWSASSNDFLFTNI